MSTRSLLVREEIILLRTKYLADVYAEYKDVVHSLNLVADSLKSLDGNEIYICEADQVRLLKAMGKNVLELGTSVNALKLYLRDIVIRLGLLP